MSEDDYDALLSDHRNKRQREEATVELCKNGPSCKFHRRGICRYRHETPWKIICNNCKREGHTTLTCPEAVCRICKQVGHASPNCPKRTQFTQQFTRWKSDFYGPPPSVAFANYFQQ